MAEPTLRLRPAREEDARVLWTWANDPAVLAAAFDPTPVSWEEFQQWLSQRLADPQWLLTVLETSAGVPIGQMRFEPRSDGWEVDFSISVEFRGRGYGALLMTEALRLAQARLPAGSRLIARVRADNPRSVALCQRAGFTVAECGSEGGRAYLRLERPLVYPGTRT